MSNNIQWIALDWGTTHFRAWAMGAGGQVLDQVKSDQGMGSLSPDEFEGVLLSQLEPWLADRQKPLTAFACGMVGARQGWTEAAYLSAPCVPPRNEQLVKAPTTDPRLNVYIVPGLSQAEPADVMRGEETQVAGFLASMPSFEGAMCMPGTHSKWVEIKNGVVERFTTFMTGEMFGLMTKHSVIKHSVAGKGWDHEQFLAGVELSMANPAMTSQELFGIRPRSILQDFGPDKARARLSGLLIGWEILATKHLWANKQICILGEPQLTKIYNIALEQQGCQATIADGDMMTLGGLHAVAVAQMEQAS